MKLFTTRFVVLAFVISLLPAPAYAQWVVYDPANFGQAVAQVANLVRTYQWLVDQARRLPASLLARYVSPEVQWRLHNLQTAYPWARPVLTALTSGDLTGQQYLRTVDALQPMDDVLEQLPPSLRRRLTDAYATIELADSVAQMSINQVGAIRTNGASVLSAIRAVENDTVDPANSFQSQTAILNKINGTSVLGLRIAERATQFQMHALEQMIVENKRRRDTEAILMNASLYQWQYGLQYGQNLYGATATNLDTWRQY
jgi:hypothetical protein